MSLAERDKKIERLRCAAEKKEEAWRDHQAANGVKGDQEAE